MIKPVFYSIFLLLRVFYPNAQENLVSNGSFEEYWECPTAPGSVGNNQLEKCKHWYKPSSATSDYYNTCQTNVSSGVSVPNNWFGYQVPFDGNAYVGLGLLIPNNPNSEYVQCKLNNPLEACRRYLFSMRVSLSDYSSRATNTLGVRFDQEPIQQTGSSEFLGFELPTHIESNSFITDTSNWVLFSGEFVAEGGEEYLTIGRFIDTNLYSNFSIPLIEVICDSCFSGHNTAYYYIDSVTLIPTDDFLVEEKIPNVLTANNDNINDYWYPNNICFMEWKCVILNRWGAEVFTFKESDFGWKGQDSIGKELAEGVYFYSIETESNKKTGFIHLIR